MKRILIASLVLTAACSPEATRVRGGDAGADVGNRNVIVEIHEGAEPYYNTPCRMTDVECPEPVMPFGTEPRRES